METFKIKARLLKEEILSSVLNNYEGLVDTNEEAAAPN
jgi:hypothetical protein